MPQGQADSGLLHLLLEAGKFEKEVVAAIRLGLPGWQQNFP